MNNADDPHFKRLAEVVERSYRAQAEDRRIHNLLNRHVVGDLYPGGDAIGTPRTSLPLLSLAARAMSRALISRAPKVIVRARNPARRPWAENRELSVNLRLQRMNAAAALREIVQQSLLSFGIMFLSPAYVGTKNGMKLDLAVEPIDRCDFGYDTRSRTLENADFQYHKFRMKIADIVDHPEFNREAAAKVSETLLREPDGEAPIRRNDDDRGNALYDEAELFCVYDQPRNMLYYYPRRQPELLLACFEWNGPRHGPYRFLYYEKAAGNAVPVAPLLHLLTKHRAYNALDMKTIHQQQAEKGLLLYTAAAKADAERIVQSLDNQTALQESGAIRWTHIGGASADTIAVAEKQRRDFSYATSGVVDQFIRQADTLGQERLLRGAASEALDAMAGQAYEFMKGFVEDLCWFDLHDPSDEPVILQKPIAGTNETYAWAWTREHRMMVDESEYEIDVVPYSYQERSPQTILADLLAGLQVMMQLGPYAAAQGVMVNAQAVLESISRLKDLPEFREWFITNRTPERLTDMMQRTPGIMGGTTDRPRGRYVRKSESDGSGVEQEILRMVGRGDRERENPVRVA